MSMEKKANIIHLIFKVKVGIDIEGLPIDLMHQRNVGAVIFRILSLNFRFCISMASLSRSN